MRDPWGKISVVIPVCNEAARLRDVLAAVGFHDDGVEVIVVDGASHDDSCALALEAGARVIHSPIRQRAAQMNLGAREAHGSVLLFLHADTQLPAGWQESVRAVLGTTPECVGGAFRRRFDSGSPLLRVTCRLADWRGRRLGWFLGDQAMFVRREVFERLGGFASLQPFEDLEFSQRLARAGRTRLLEDVVISSGRRFAARGALLQTLSDLALTLRYLTALRRFRDVARPAPPDANRAAGLARMSDNAVREPSE